MNDWNFWRNQFEDMHRRCRNAERRADKYEDAYKFTLVVAAIGWSAFFFSVAVRHL